ncbi:MAG TPA: hypothetical protein VFB72_02785 [Verrucomicrobiae bacterium]|nr:hypothetical protein [Verrucomicrobiae bacterium]
MTNGSGTITSGANLTIPGNLKVNGTLTGLATNISAPNLVPAGAMYDNGTSTFDTDSGETAGYGPINLTVGAKYVIVSGNTANDDFLAFFGPSWTTFVEFGGGVAPNAVEFTATANQIWIGGNNPSTPVATQIYAVGGNTVTASNIYAQDYIGIQQSNLPPNLASNILLTNYNFGNGFLPLHQSLMTRQMPVPLAMYSTYLGPLSGALITNMVNQLVASNLVVPGWSWIEIDAGWQQTNYLRSAHPGSLLNCNSNLFPQGIPAITAYAHANGIKVMLYTTYGDEPCGGSYPGQRACSPPGYLYGDVIQMASWGVDGINVDDCGLANNSDGLAHNEISLRQMYVELDNGISHVNAHPTADNTDGSPAPQIMPVRIASDRAGVQQYSWEAVEGNIIFDGSSPDDTTLVSDMQNWMHVYKNNWLVAPGHYYQIDNLDDSHGTNVVVYQMTMMAVLHSPCLLGGISAANVPWYGNSEVMAIYQDSGVIPASLVSNNANGYVFTGKLGSATSISNSIAFANTNQSSAETITIPCTAMGIASNAPFTVRDVWSHADLGYFVNSFSQTVPTNSARLYIATATPNCVGGGVNNGATGSIGSTLAYTNSSGGTRYLRCSLGVDVTGTSAGGTIAFTLTSTNAGSGSYTMALPNISTTSKGFYSTNWTLVVSNTTDITYTTTVSGSPSYNLLIVIEP